MRIETSDKTYLSIKDEYGNIINQPILVVAKTGGGKGLCISDKSFIKTINGNILLKSIKPNKSFQIISYNFNTKKEEKDFAKRIITGKKIVYELITESGKKIKASKDHVFFVKKGNKIIEKRLEELNEKDKIFTY